METLSMSMGKGDLTEAIAKKAEISKAQAASILNITIDAIQASLKKGKKVSITGFGTFLVRKRKARTGRNPQTGKTIKIAAKKVAAFKAGATLKSAVN